jgi:Tetracyclin repressor-like, C-terminal domain
MSRFLPAHEHELLVKVQRTYYELVRSRIEDAMTPHSGIDPVVAAFAVINLCDRVTSWYSPGGRLGPEELADTYVHMVRGMLYLPG